MELLKSLELIGPGRWLERPVLEQWFSIQKSEQQRITDHAAKCQSSLLAWLQSAGLEPGTNLRSTPDTQITNPSQLAGCWLAETGVALQQWAGHPVQWATSLPADREGVVRVIFEFEDLTTGKRAAELALELVNLALVSTAPETLEEPLVAMLAEYRSAAVERVFPLEGQILMAAAEARDIPVCKLDREPYEPISGEFRLRNNGLLRFGHACFQQVVDGTFCLDRSAVLLKDLGQPVKELRMLRAAGAPVPRFDEARDAFRFTRKALNGANRIGYPVVVNPTGRSIGQPVSSEAELELLLRKTLKLQTEVFITSWVAGKHFRILCAGQELIAVVDANGQEVTESCAASLLDCAGIVAQSLPAGMLVLHLVTPDLSADLSVAGGAFIGMEVCPQIDHLLPPDGELIRLMAVHFLNWMFPDGSTSRIPLFSVTGTNGKTTTCRMLSRIARQAGFRVGLACTDGIYVNEKLVDTGDYAGCEGHHRVLESRDVNLGVLETARGAVLHSGFAFDQCDVSLCTNVTPEHLGEYGIETVEQMTELKRLIVAKARKSAVLNFDDPQCRRIGDELSVPRLCWSSVLADADVMANQGIRADRLIYLETEEGLEWVTCRESGLTTRLIPVNEMPASFAGAARHNLSNAMQAIGGALEMGISWPVIHAAMSTFSMSISDTPGRLNIHEGPDFTVLMDFVQNLGGMRALCEFTEKLQRGGKRILVLSVLGRHNNETIREFARLAADYFDRFICRNYLKTYEHRSVDEIPHLLRTSLMEYGVPEANITIELDEEPAINTALMMAERGDLVVITCGLRTRENWQQITNFSGRR